MKIVHVGFSHRPDDIRIFQKECCSLKACGYEVTYITSNRYAEQPNGIYKGVQVVVLKLKNAKRARRFLCYCKDLKRQLVLLDADVYHFHEVILLPILAYMHRRGKIVIYDLHEDSPRQLEPPFCKKYGHFFGKLLVGGIELYENHWLKKVNYVIAATPHIGERCKKYTSKVSVVANYPLLNEVSERSSNPIKKEKMVCYTGGISELNGIFNIIRALEYVQGGMHLAGGLSDELRKELQMYPGWCKVQEWGYISKNEVQELFQKSMAGLVLYQPSGNTMEAMPNKLFEYMEAGLPVIVSDFPLWREIVEKDGCGICVNPSKPREIAEAINQLLNNPEKAEQMGENGKKLVQQKYNWQGGAGRNLKKVYQNIVLKK